MVIIILIIIVIANIIDENKIVMGKKIVVPCFDVIMITFF